MNKKFRQLLSAVIAVSVVLSSVPLTASADTMGFTDLSDWGSSDFTADETVAEASDEETAPAETVIETVPEEEGGEGITTLVNSIDPNYVYVAPEETEVSEIAVNEVKKEIEIPAPVLTEEAIEKVASGTASGTCGTSATWSISSDGTLTVSGTGAMTDYTVDNAINGEWRSYLSLVKKVVIGSGITSVGDYSFFGFTALESVTLSGNVTVIGEHAFYGCTSLKTVSLGGAKLTSIEAGAFYNCKPLTSFAIPSTVTNIGDDAFAGCKTLTTVTIPAAVGKNFGASAFNGCDALKTVVVSDGVTLIPDNAFAGCSSLTTLTIPKTGLLSIGEGAFTGCIALATVNGDSSCLSIPESVTTIGKSAFSGCTSLSSVAFSKDLTSIGANAFDGCTGITALNITGTKGVTIANEAFANCGKLTAVTMEGEVTSIGKKGFYKSGVTNIALSSAITSIGELAFSETNLKSIVIPKSTTEIGKEAFAACTNLTSATISETDRNAYATVGEKAFRDCTALASIDMSGVESWGISMFLNCSALKSASLSTHTVEMGKETFKGCKNLASLTIPEGCAVIAPGVIYDNTLIRKVTIPSTVIAWQEAFEGSVLTTVVCASPTIGFQTFLNCKYLTTVTLSNTRVLDKEAFAGCEALTSIKLPDTVEYIGISAFSDCKKLASVNIPDVVTDVCDKAFMNCTSLTAITLPANVTSICASVFSGCTSLSTVNCKGAVTSIGKEAFKGCIALTKAVIPSTVTAIGIGAFQNCTGITSAAVPSGVTVLNNYTFDGCTNLGTVTIDGSLATIGTYAFQNCVNLTGFTIPSTVTTIGNYAFAECKKLDSPIPSGIKVNGLGTYTFKNCTSLGAKSTVAIPAAITKIPAGLFYGCTSLPKLSISTAITDIGNEAFFGCTNKNFNAAIIPETVKAVGVSAFEGCTYLANVTINYTSTAGCTTVNNKAFKDCKNLTSITLPSTLTKIGTNAFENCGKLGSINVTGKLETLGGSAFLNCTSLKKVTLSAASITKVDLSTFEGCTALTTVDLPDSVTNISGKAFMNCKSLDNFNIPGAVTAIGANAFDGCASLSSIIVPIGSTMATSCFANCAKLETAIVLSSKPVAKTAKIFENCPLVTIYCYENAPIGVTYAEGNDIPYEIISGSDGSYLVLLKALPDIKGLKYGETATLTASAASEGLLKYEWYYKNPGATKFTKSSITGKTYSVVFSAQTDGQLVYCKITSVSPEDGSVINTITSNTAKIASVEKPKITLAAAGNAKVTLKWNAVDGATKYRVFYYTGGKYKTVRDVTATNTVVTGLTNGTKYGFLVRAYVDGAWTPYTTADNAYATPVNKPVVTAYAGNGKVRLSWGKISGASKYAIYTYLNGKYTLYKATTANYYDVKSLTNGTKYGFLVKAYVGGKWTTYNAYDLAYATPVEKPVVTAYAGNGKVRLNWTKVTGATKYAIYTYVNGKYTLYKATTATAYNVTGLTNNTKYGFLVKAYVGGKWTTYNALDLAYATPIDKPAITKTVAASGRVRLYWNKVAGATKYAIYTYSGGKYSLYKYTTANAYTVSGLKNGTAYGFLVRAYVNGKWTTYNVYDRVTATPKA